MQQLDLENEFGCALATEWPRIHQPSNLPLYNIRWKKKSAESSPKMDDYSPCNGRPSRRQHGSICSHSHSHAGAKDPLVTAQVTIQPDAHNAGQPCMKGATCSLAHIDPP